MPKRTEYRFTIDVFTPDTIPMARLAEYMISLARVLGEPELVRFIRLDRGSAQIVHAVDDTAIPKMHERISGLPDNRGPSDALNAFYEMNERLRSDNAVGVLTDAQENNVIAFPGRETPEPVIYGPLKQIGFLDGNLIRVGGKGEIVSVHIQQDEQIYKAKATRELAIELGHHLFDDELRFYGVGRWIRNASGKWECKDFRVERFDQLKKETLSEAVSDLRNITNSGWHEIDDVWSELSEIRLGTKETH